MRPRFLISLTFVLLSLFTIVFWFSSVKPKGSLETLQKTVQPTNQPLAEMSVATQNTSNPLNQTAEVVSPPISQLPTPKQLEDAQKIYESFNKNHNLPIEFYGQVIDQDSNPISNAKINVSISQTFIDSPSNFAFTPKTFHIGRETGTDGRFEITGEKAEGVTVESIQKDGFEVEPDYCPHTFGVAGGIFERPMVFKMWSTNIHEPLITGGNKFPILPDGRIYFIDLTKGTISESGEGDLKVWIQYTNQPVRGQFSDWSAEINVVAGGLLETKDYSMFSAPTEGYVPSFFWKNQIKGGQRGNIGERRFYLKLKNGQEYGRMVIELHAPFNNQIPGLIRLSYAINPSGSRILR